MLPPSYLWGRRCHVSGVSEKNWPACVPGPWKKPSFAPFEWHSLSGSRWTWPRTDSFCFRTWSLETALHGSLCRGPGTGSWGSRVSAVLRKLTSGSGLQFTDTDGEPGELLSHQEKHWLGNTLVSRLEGSEQQGGVKVLEGEGGAQEAAPRQVLSHQGTQRLLSMAQRGG